MHIQKSPCTLAQKSANLQNSDSEERIAGMVIAPVILKAPHDSSDDRPSADGDIIINVISMKW